MDIEKDHNDEKVMREVKSISEEIIEEPKFNGNLRTGGTDHRQRKLIYQKKDRKEKQNDRNITVKMDVDQ